jgi:hypothetical protein
MSGTLLSLAPASARGVSSGAQAPSQSWPVCLAMWRTNEVLPMPAWPPCRIALPGSLGGGSPYRAVQDSERLIALEQVHGPTLPGSGRPAVRENGPGSDSPQWTGNEPDAEHRVSRAMQPETRLNYRTPNANDKRSLECLGALRVPTT